MESNPNAKVLNHILIVLYNFHKHLQLSHFLRRKIIYLMEMVNLNVPCLT